MEAGVEQNAAVSFTIVTAVVIVEEDCCQKQLSRDIGPFCKRVPVISTRREDAPDIEAEVGETFVNVAQAVPGSEQEPISLEKAQTELEHQVQAECAAEEHSKHRENEVQL
jgi:hypothetical protein